MEECKPLAAGRTARVEAADVERVERKSRYITVRRCRLTVSRPVLIAPMVSALEATI